MSTGRYLPQFWRNVIGGLTLKLETLISSETSLTFYQSTQRNMPEDTLLQNRAAVKFKLVPREGVTSWCHNIITNPHDRV